MSPPGSMLFVIVARSAPVARFQTFALPSRADVTSDDPEGANATLTTAPP